MSKCVKIRTKKRKVCIGDLRDLIKLQNRDILEPIFGSPNFDEGFTDIAEVWAAINTVSGKEHFDDVGVGTTITHLIYIRYDALVTSETWVEFNNRRFDILDTEDVDERGEFLKLTCVDRGLVSKEASKS